MKNEKFTPVKLYLIAPIIMQIAITMQLVWGALGNAWDKSWLCSYVGVIICIELFMYNNVVKKGERAIKALYPIIILNGFAFFFTVGFTVSGGWAWSWCGLVAAAIGVLIVMAIAKATSKE
ncbi:MAG: hypothetical protein IJU04_05555 [Ruminococcus sp.]|nr:hypothetical protein [Ruminococcus sp.]